VPFGWTRGIGGELIEDSRQQAAIKRMRQMRDRGDSLRAMAIRLQGEGFPISHAGIKKVLQGAAVKSVRPQ
jgi:hypothetical protein